MIKVIYGDEPYIVDETAKKLIGQAKEEFRLSTFAFWSDEIPTILNSISLFGEPVIVVNCDSLPATDDFVSLVQRGTDGCLIVIAKSVDKRTNIYKLLHKQNLLIECCKPSLNDACRFAEQRASLLGLKIDKDAASCLISRLGYADDASVNLYTVDIAVKQLYFLGLEGNITKTDVICHVPENIVCKVFDLFNALLRGDMQRYFRMYAELRQQENAIGIMSCLLRSARIGFKKAVLKDDPKCAARIGVSPAAIKYAANLRLEHLKKMVDAFQDAVNQVKNGVDDNLAFSVASYKAYAILKGGTV